MPAAALVLLAIQALQVVPTPERTLGPLPLLTLYSRKDPPGVFELVDQFVVLDRERVAIRPPFKREILIIDREGHERHRIDAHLDIRLLAGFGPRRLIYWVYNAVDPRTGEPCNLWSAGVDDDSPQPFAACPRCEILGMTALDGDVFSVLVTERDADGTKHELLKSFDTSGAERFSTPVPMVCNSPFASEDGRIGVIHFEEPEQILWFDRDGRAAGSTELEAGSGDGGGDAHVFVSFLLSCADGSMIAPISGPTYAAVLQFDDRGRKLRDTAVRFAEGWYPSRWCFRGPDHAPWVYDGHAFLRLGLDGVCTTEFAEPGDANRLLSATRIVVDPEGDVYALAARDHVLHVFDAGGRRLERILPVDPESLGPSSFRWDPAEEPLPPAKHAWIEKGWLGPERAGLHFEPRLNNDPWQVALVDQARNVVRILEPPGPRDRYSTAAPSQTAADGSIAVVWRSPSESLRRPLAAWYDATGVMRGAFLLPMNARYAYVSAWDGHRLAVAHDLRLHLFDMRGRLLADRWLSDRRDYEGFRRRCRNGPDSTLCLDFGAGGCELWVRHGVGNLVIERFEIP